MSKVLSKPAHRKQPEAATAVRSKADKEVQYATVEETKRAFQKVAPKIAKSLEILRDK